MVLPISSGWPTRPMTCFLPSPRTSLSTVAALLHHTAGLPANLTWSAIVRKGGDVREQRRAALLEAARTYAPPKAGKSFLYSNLGYVILYR